MFLRTNKQKKDVTQRVLKADSPYCDLIVVFHSKEKRSTDFEFPSLWGPLEYFLLR